MSEQAPRAFSTEFKERAVQRLEAGASASALAAGLGVRRKLLYDWQKAYRREGVAGPEPQARAQVEEATSERPARPQAGG